MQSRRRNSHLLLPILFVAALLVLVFKIAPKQPVQASKPQSDFSASSSAASIPSQK